MNSGETPSTVQSKAAALLASADQASTQMVRSAQIPRGFTALAVVLFSAAISIKDLVPLWVPLLMAAAVLPLLFWLLLHSRRRAKMRPLGNVSSLGGWYFFFFMLTSLLFTLWDAATWLEAGIKMAACTAAAGFLTQRMLAELTCERVQDGNEQAR